MVITFEFNLIGSMLNNMLFYFHATFLFNVFLLVRVLIFPFWSLPTYMFRVFRPSSRFGFPFSFFFCVSEREFKYI